MRSRPKWWTVVVVLGLIGATAIAMPALGIDKRSKKTIKKEVRKQISKLNLPAGPPGAKGASGLNGSARAYARVFSDAAISCNAGCTFDRAKGITEVQHPGTGVYCVIAPGIDPAVTPAAVTADFGSTNAPEGNASALYAGPCGNGFAVRTERQPSTNVRNAADNGQVAIAGNAAAADDVGFTIVIP